MDQLAIARPRQGGVSRPARRGHRRGHGAGDPRGLSGRRRLSRPAGQAVPAVNRRGGRKKSLIKVVDPAPADPGRRRRASARSISSKCEASAHHPRQGRGLRASRRGYSRARGKDRHSLSADVDGQGFAARHARAIGLRRALVRAAGSRRRDADRRASTPRRARARPGVAPARRRGADRSSSRSTSRRRKPTATSASMRRSLVTSARVSRDARGDRSRFPKPPAEWLDAIAERRTRTPRRWGKLAKNPTPMNYHSALNVVRDIVKANPDAILVNGRERARSHAQHRRHVQAAQTSRRRHVGRDGHRHGHSVAAAVVCGEQGSPSKATARSVLRHGSRDDLPLPTAGLRRDPEQQRCPRRRSESDGGRDPSPLVFVKGASTKADGCLRRRGRAGHDAGGAAARWKRQSARASRR